MTRGALTALLLVCAVPLAGQAPDTTNLMQRSEIREIRALVADLESQIRNGRLAAKDSSGYCEFSGDTTYVRYLRGPSGRVRRAIVRWSIRGYGRRIEYTFDTTGTLRYAAERRTGPDSSEAGLAAYWRPDHSMILSHSWIIRTRVYPWSELPPLFDPKYATALFCSGD